MLNCFTLKSTFHTLYLQNSDPLKCTKSIQYNNRLPFLPEAEPLVVLVPVLVLPHVGEARVAEDEPVVAPRGVRVVGHVVAQDPLQELRAIPEWWEI